MTEPFHLLFVCTANICRSLYAEGRALQLLPRDSPITVSSAGTHGFTDHPLDADMAACLLAHGPHAPLRSRRLDSGILSEADLVLTAESAHRNFIVEEWPTAYRRVFTFSQFAATISALPATLNGTGLVNEAYRRRVRASRSGDVPDPYRRGRSAAAASSALIDRYLAEILPHLA